ncbi:MAG TPA: lipoprotein insertase outer membrane protein LolB [Steroidobacteraceae bacterium]|nr:lipoprotein insertase outer membrane protein LolB [Steroidobacteraceae bacterium]
MRISALRLAAAATLLLAACRTTQVPLPPSAPWDQRRPQLQAWEHFELRGRVAVATADSGFNANLLWAQDGARSALTLEGPLGAGAVKIDSSGRDLDIVNANGEHLDSDTARAELRSRLGFEPPFGSLRYWVLGVPDPTQPAQESLDPAQQRLSALTQSGWHIDYSAYTAVGAEALPQRLTLEREAVRLKLLVDHWQL